MEQQELISSGVAEIASGLGIGSAEPEAPEVEEPVTEGAEKAATDLAGGSQDEPVVADEENAEAAETPAVEETEQPKGLEPPRSWAKANKELWDKIPPEAQEYYIQRETQMLEGMKQYKQYSEIGKTLNDIIAPYRPIIQADGLDDAKAVAALFNAHYRLTQGTMEQRLATYRQLGASLGFVQQGAEGEQQQIDPVLAQTRQELQEIRNALTQRQRVEYEQARVQVTREVDSFAKDHPHFDEVAADMAVFINAGDDMQTAYDKAVRANPSTYAKERARLEKEIEAKLRSKANGEAQAARRATAANVTGRDTTRTPTEAKGKFLDEKSMQKDLDEILARRTH